LVPLQYAAHVVGTVMNNLSVFPVPHGFIQTVPKPDLFRACRLCGCVQSLVQPSAGREVPARIRSLCIDLSAHTQQIIAAFGIPDHLVAAPIAADWEKYNEVDNRGELFGDDF
jgi:hypothetical protein